MTAGALFAQEDQLIIVGNAASVPSELDMSQLKSILKGEKLRWNDGSKVSLALMKTSTPVGTETCKKLYNMTANELNKYFLALVFQGKVNAPTFFNSSSELEAYVAETPGAIGVMRQPAGKTLKVILVDGKTQI
jgi:hypothetical protein